MRRIDSPEPKPEKLSIVARPETADIVIFVGDDEAAEDKEQIDAQKSHAREIVVDRAKPPSNVKIEVNERDHQSGDAAKAGELEDLALRDHDIAFGAEA